MVLVYCTSSQHMLSLKERNLNKIPSTVLELCPEQENLIQGNNSKRKQGRVKVLYTALSLNVFYPFIKFQQNHLNRVEVMHRTMQVKKW